MNESSKACPSCGKPERIDSDITGLHPECPLPAQTLAKRFPPLPDPIRYMASCKDIFMVLTDSGTYCLWDGAWLNTSDLLHGEDE